MRKRHPARAVPSNRQGSARAVRLGLLTLGALALPAVLPQARAATPGPVLFDGKSLAGWEGNPALWRVQDGQIIGTIKDKLGDNEFLINQHGLKNFRLTVEVKLTTRDNNSGIQFRSEKVNEKGHASVGGYQADIGGPDGQFWCDVYDEHGRGWLFTEGPPKGGLLGGAWNVYEIVASGSKIMAALNGRRCFEIDDKDKGAHAAGVIALQLHAGGPMEVRFRNFNLTIDPEPALETAAFKAEKTRGEGGKSIPAAQAARQMTVPAGFHVDAIASEPAIRQPVAFTFDERGRIWVAEAYSYPQRRAEGKGQDRLVILADEDKDGTFETRKGFVDNLNLVSGFELGFGGVWVGAAPHLLFLADRNGDDKPDGAPEILLDGFAFDDTHETPNSFIWGPDGWLYGNHGVFNDSMVGKPGAAGKDRTYMSPAVWRYHPTRHVFEVFAHGGSNQWGLDFNDDGQAFITTCRSRNGGGPVTHVVQGGYYWRQAGAHKYAHVYEPMLAAAEHDHGWGGAGGNDLLYGGHAHVGAMIYQGDNWPAAYRNQLFTHNLHGGRINHEIIAPRGSGYLVSHAEQDLLFVNDPWFVGVALKSGPDGAAYMIDWYDQQHCHHHEVESWDRSNGRVYRVAYGTPERKSVDLSCVDDRTLVDLQLHANEWHVRTARRLLQERAARGALKPEVVTALRQQFAAQKERGKRLRSLWALHAVGGLDAPLRARLLTDKDEMVRGWAVQLATENDTAASVWTSLAREAGREKSDVVRRYLASALQRAPLPARYPIIEGLATGSAAAGDEQDKNMPNLIWVGLEPLVADNLPRALALATRIRSAKLRGFVYRRAALEKKGLDPVVARLTAASASRLAGSAADPSETERKLILRSLNAALEGQTDLAMPASWSKAARVLYTSPDLDERGFAETLGAQFGDKTVLPPLRTALADAKTGAKRRAQVLKVLVAARDTEALPIVHGLLDDPAFRISAIAALAKFDHPDSGTALLSRYAKFSVTEQSAAMNTLVSRPRHALAFLDAVEKGSMPKKELTAFFARQLARLNDAQVKEKLTALWGATRTMTEDKAAEIATVKAMWSGNREWIYSAVKGRVVYEKLCKQCHKLFGEGGNIGPDLTESNRQDTAYLIENIVDPSALIGKDFQLTVIETKDGQLLSGMVAETSARTVSLITLNERVVLDRKNIATMQPSDASMMPEGLLAGLSEADIQNLLKYLRGTKQPTAVAATPAAPAAASAPTARTAPAVAPRK